MNDQESNVVRVGSRKSELALIQTRHVISLLKQLYPNRDFEIVTMSTLGDRVLNISLPKIGEKSLFTKDLEEALENGSVDLVVHSLKDLPTTLPQGMAIGAVLEREDPRDALVLREDYKGHTLATLPQGSIIGTSSLRRTAQLSRNYPHLKVVDIRGNLNTRLKKLDYNCKSLEQTKKCEKGIDNNIIVSNGNGSLLPSDNSAEKDEALYPNYSAIILANAGLVRMGWQHRISQVLPCKEVLYAVGQGALAVECRANNQRILEMLAPLNDEITYCRILAERSFLRTLGGGCSAPVAISTNFKQSNGADVSKNQLNITGAVWSLDGKTELQKSLEQVFESVEWLSKPKTGKHKMSNLETSYDASNAKIPKTICSGVSKQESTDDATSKPLCCRQKTINMTMEKAEPVEIENLINIHGKLFRSCPFSDKKGSICPVRLPIGEEFMGTCPYLSSNDEGFNEALVKLHPRRQSYDIKKCPFMSNQAVAIDTQIVCDNMEYNIEKEPKAKNCPFLKSKLQSQCNSDNLSTTESSLKVPEEEIQLFCGLTKHFQIPVNVLEKCEELGIKLAQSLIEVGALEVMKCSQDFIRGSVTSAAIASS
ncbi:porphobilinogen deaminase-like protein l(3)02640 [Arctopsyche grandis]|uniref:porphobilinogen deaminase-like protein l(3)02640 n=1 Tax=Arctopsyche grandis TaxID=121162 RepID=UPI00406D7398